MRRFSEGHVGDSPLPISKQPAKEAHGFRPFRGVQSITACSLRAVIRPPRAPPYIGFGAIQEPNFPDYRRAKPNPAESGFETVSIQPHSLLVSKDLEMVNGKIADALIGNKSACGKP
jgi:hypothetical protein